MASDDEDDMPGLVSSASEDSDSSDSSDAPGLESCSDEDSSGAAVKGPPPPPAFKPGACAARLAPPLPCGRRREGR
jgi:hypothetical protein